MRVVVAALLLAGCAARARDPVLDARAVVRRAASAVSRADDATLASLLSAGPHARTPSLDPVEREAAARSLERAASGVAQVHATARMEGPLGVRYELRETREGWRVDPDTVSLPTPSPRAAIEQLAQALDRVENDPALALLTSTLREVLVRSSRERARGLREIAAKLSDDPAASRAPLQIEYGAGLFVVLRPELDGWRVDDFN